MVDAGNIQKRMNEMQNSEAIQNIFGKLVSGKLGYKAVIEVTKPTPKCSQCQTILGGEEKFCPECGNKLDWKK